MSQARKVHVKSFGCQMNVYDSQRMADLMVAAGFTETSAPDDADLLILNTCNIREKAADKLYSELGRTRALKDAAKAQGRDLIVAVAGCVAQAEGGEIVRRSPMADIVVGSQNYHRLPDYLSRAAQGDRIVDTEFPAHDKFDALPAPQNAATRARGIAAFVTVQEGCDKFCTFCVVPYTRGAEVSRPVMKVIAEIERLAGAGVREVTLIGQNVNAYHGEGPDGRDWTLGRLIERAARVEGIVRLRYTTSHPHDMEASLIAAHRDLPALMPYVHLPVQSGSDRVLAAMNRNYTRADFLGAVERLRAARGDIAFSSDFIAGFPSETAAEFEETLSLIREVGFAAAYSFAYSPRPGTPAAEMTDQVPEAEKSERLQRLQALIAQAQLAFNASCLGRRLDVLLEKPGRLPGQLVGRSPYLQSVHVMAQPSLIGSVVAVDITALGANTLFGALTSTSSPGSTLPFVASDTNIHGA